MRIISGALRGRNLEKPSRDFIRPTSDQNREALFNILMHKYDSFLKNARVLDLFAGTGALGIEALSRGAQYCVFIDKNVEARALIRENVENLGLNGQTKIFRRDATELGIIGTLEPFNLIFVDPPYGKNLAEKALQSACKGKWLSSESLCIVEEEASCALSLPESFILLEERFYKGTTLKFFKFSTPDRDDNAYKL